MLREACVTLAVLYAVLTVCAQDPSYDRQTKTYNAQFHDVSAASTGTYMPYFSPEHSTDTHVELINSAQSTIDIATPSYGSWSGCSYGDTCAGCNITAMHNEAFPIFPAVLNAVHQRGVKVRVVTNAVFSNTCEGKIQAFDWWSLNGIEVRVFTTTTFHHGKYINVDGKSSAVSSINWSQTSYLKNREAGVVVTEPALVAMYQQVFDFDFNQGLQYVVNNTYTKAELAIIQSTAAIPVVIPNVQPPSGAYITPKPTPLTGTWNGRAGTSPDYARTTLEKDLDTAQKSVQLMIYQVTDSYLCDRINELHSKGLTMTILVSAHIYSYDDWKTAQECYSKLYDNGVHVQLTWTAYTYSHQKFWVIDNTTVSVDTGNWSPSDFTTGTTFPPYGESGWKKTNRDFMITVTSPGMVSVFYKLLHEDYQRGTAFHPSTNPVRHSDREL